MSRFFVSCITVILIYAGNSSAQKPITFDHLGVPQGLSSSNVRSICQDRFGFLWIGTDDGLNQYDGYQFKVYKSGQDSTTLSDNRISGVFEDSQGVLWVTTQSGLSRWDRETEEFKNYLPDPLSTLATDQWLTSIHEDSHHRLWVSSRYRGLTRFDRKNKTFEPMKLLYPDGIARYFGGPNSAFIESASGEIYTASWNEGILKFNEEKQYFELVELKGDVPKDFIFSFHEDKTGSMWAGGISGLFRIDPNRMYIEKVPLLSDLKKKIQITSILEDDEGLLWISSDIGVFTYNIKTKALKQNKSIANNSKSLSENSIWTSYMDNFGILWFGTVGGGLNSHDPQKIAFTAYTDFNSDPESGKEGIYSIAQDFTDYNILYLSTDNGIVKFDRNANTHTWLKGMPTLENSGVISDILVENKNILWMGSFSNGLYRYDLKNGQVKNYKGNLYTRNSLFSNRIYDLEMDDYGNLWIATADGLNRMDARTGGIERIPGLMGRMYHPEIIEYLQKLFASGQSLAQIRQPGDYAALEDTFEIQKSTQVLVVSAGEGTGGGVYDYGSIESGAGDTLWTMNDLRKTFYLNGDYKNRIQIDILPLQSGSYRLRYQSDDSHSYGKWNNPPPADSIMWGINAFALSEDDAEWIKRLLDADVKKTFIEGDTPFSLQYSSKGYLWIGSDQGLSRFELKNREITNYLQGADNPGKISNVRIDGILEDREGILWLATARGLIRFDQKTGGYVSFDEKKGLPSGQLRAITEDAAGDLWISSLSGISKYEKNRQGTNTGFINFDLRDGLQGYTFYTNSVCATPNGELFFGGKDGMNSFFPEIINSDPPRIVLSNLLISNQPVRVGTDDSPLVKSLLETESIVLAHDQNDLSFEFAPIHFSRPDKNQIFYKLEGYQNEWVNNGRRFASFTNLDPGEYTLKIRAVSSNGIPSETDRNLHITIRLPWWQTTWAYAGYVIIFLLGIFTVDRIQRFRLTQRERSMALIREAELRLQVAESENQRKSKEMEEARHLQLSLLPEKLPDVPNLEIAVYMKTATEVGGDYYDYSISADGTLNIVLGDASGHGMRAGTMVTLMKGLFSADQGNGEISNFLQNSSDIIKNMRFDRVMMALTLIRIKENKMTYSSAGMPPAFLYRKARQRVEEICLQNVPLGAIKNQIYQVQEEYIESGDTMLLLSDGLPELRNPNGLIFDYPRVEQVFKESAHESPQKIIDQLVKAGKEWALDRIPEDDITFMVLKVV